MTTLYKLTDENCYTRRGEENETLWEIGKMVKVADGHKPELCSAGVIHAYEHPLLALLFNPIHANFSRPRLWQAEGEIVVRDGQGKCGCRSLTLVKELLVPEVTTTAIVAFGILAALEVYKEEKFVIWANDWLSGKDRSKRAAYAADSTATSAAAYAASAAYAAYAATSATATSAAAYAASAAYAANLVSLVEKALRIGASS